MATLALTGPADLLRRLVSEPSVTVSVVISTAEENDDGTWTVTAYAAEDQIPALEALGHTVTVIADDATLLAQWDGIPTDDTGIA